MNFDKLDAYAAAIDYVGLTRPLVVRTRAGDPALSDQLQRAVLSIPCNLAEGAGEFSPGDKVRFYRYALRSSTEAVALLDSAHRVALCPEEEHRRCRAVGMRLVAMLTKLVLSTSGPRRDRAQPEHSTSDTP